MECKHNTNTAHMTHAHKHDIAGIGISALILDTKPLTGGTPALKLCKRERHTFVMRAIEPHAFIESACDGSTTGGGRGDANTMDMSLSLWGGVDGPQNRRHEAVGITAWYCTAARIVV